MHLDSFEDWDAHKSVILHTVKNSPEPIERAIAIVEKWHNTPRTLYVGNYNRHPLRVARILVEEFEVTNPKTLLIALCHDLEEWSEYNMEELEKEFGTDVKAGVALLTWKEQDTWGTFFQKITNSKNKDLIKIKIADKLDNNRAAAFSNSLSEKQKARDKTELILRPYIEKTFPQCWKKFEESIRNLSISNN